MLIPRIPGTTYAISNTGPLISAFQSNSSIAKQFGVKLSGFPGALLLAVQNSLISAEDMRTRLERCRAQGTHYSIQFIQAVYDMAQYGRR